MHAGDGMHGACAHAFLVDAHLSASCVRCPFHVMKLVSLVYSMHAWPAETGADIGNIYLSATNPIARPPASRVEGTANYNNYTPSYNCTVSSKNNAPHTALHARIIASLRVEVAAQPWR